MTNEELREGLARILACCEWDNVGEREISVMRPVADAALAYLHAHDGHAEFVRAVRNAAQSDGFPNSALQTIRELCAVELEKESSNG